MNPNDLISAIARAAKVGDPSWFTRQGTVKVVTDKLCEIKLPDGEIKRVEWFFPGKPLIGSKCLVIYRDNMKSRPIAIGFSKLDSIKTKIGEAVSVEIDKSKIEISLGGFKISTDGIQATIKIGALEFSGVGESWTFKGKVNFESDVSFSGDIDSTGKIHATKKISSDDDVMVGTISVKEHPHPYTDTPVGPSVTGPPK